MYMYFGLLLSTIIMNMYVSNARNFRMIFQIECDMNFKKWVLCHLQYWIFYWCFCNGEIVYNSEIRCPYGIGSAYNNLLCECNKVLFVDEFCERVFTVDTRACSLRTFKISRTPLCLRVRITHPWIIVTDILGKTEFSVDNENAGKFVQFKL